MSCSASHLGFPIGIRNRIFVEDLPMNIGPYGKSVSKHFLSEITWTI
jgi:hypothetical protein